MYTKRQKRENCLDEFLLSCTNTVILVGDYGVVVLMILSKHAVEEFTVLGG